MLRNESPLTQLVYVDKIEQILDEIETYGQILYDSTTLDSVRQTLESLSNAINDFEDNKYDDYFNDNTSHADQVLDTRKIFNALYKESLKHDPNVSRSSKLFKSALTDYAKTVQELRDSISDEVSSTAVSELSESLDSCHQKNSVTQAHDMLLSREKQAILKVQAEMFKDQFERAGLLENDELAQQQREYADGYDYFGVMDMETSSDSDWQSDNNSIDADDYSDTPYFPATFDFAQAQDNGRVSLNYSFDFGDTELDDFWNKVYANSEASESSYYDNVVSITEDSKDQSSEWNLDDIFDPSSDNECTELDISTDEEFRLSGGSWSSDSGYSSPSSPTFFRMDISSDSEESYSEDYSPKGYITL